MTKSDKALGVVLAIGGGIMGFNGLGIWLTNEDVKLTDPDVAANLLTCAGALAALKSMLNTYKG